MRRRPLAKLPPLSTLVIATGTIMSEQDAPLIYTCGQSEVDLVMRTLRVDGVPAQLSSRAFDVLAVLVQSAGRLATKDDFKGDVWAGAIVEENTLQVHISAIRRALGADRDLLKTVSRRGYRLLGNWTTGHQTYAEPATLARDAPAENRGLPRRPPGMVQNLPARLTRVIGRDHDVLAIAEQLTDGRFVSVIGPGGVGKTTVAIVTGHTLLQAFGDAVYFVDLGPVRDTSLVASLVATTLGIVVRTEDPVTSIIVDLQDRSVLLILDSCEHVISSVATLAERVHRETSQVRILATSREALRVGGEHVHYLHPLESPPDRAGLTAAEALAFPSVQLFMDRAAVGGLPFRLSDDDAPVIAGLCRALDGLALAIELAAGQAVASGVEETARLVGNHLRLQLQGSRTALPRHRTLTDALDWSYALLSNLERTILRRLAVFAGSFIGLEPVLYVTAGIGLDQRGIADAFEGLVSKSLVAVNFEGPSPRYRLLDTTRAYAQMKLAASGEEPWVVRQHAKYFSELLVRARETTTKLS